MNPANTSRCRLCGKALHEDPSQDGLCHQCRSSSPVEEAPPTADEAAIGKPDASSPSVLPDHIGPYKVLDFLGEGGMGVVYLAEQEQPIRRKVALKVIKLGMDTKEVIARFESERQALAMMNHPNIAQVHDAGTTDRGAPYFVMEYVPGVPIADYCDKHRLSTRERLEMFIPVCQAIQHAHQKGIIHRDIKPSNILVSVLDGKPVPKVIDFGVAKATNQRLTEKTVFTQQGYLIGTPEYMSPEQAEMTGLDVDTTTDIYSLGVLLYELLVGALPLDARALRRAGFDEIRRIIREVDPPKPTTRLSSLGQLAKGIAERRHTDVVSLAKELRGDIDWITLKAMEKDRTRRYASSSELAADIERHLRNEPVVACPPSSMYRMHKFVRRHRMGVSVAAAAAVLLAAFAVTMALQAQRIARERDRANREAKIAQEVSEFLVSLFAISDPFEGRGKNVTAREILDTGSARIGSELQNQPEVRATLSNTMGQVYRNLGIFDKASELVQAALTIRERQGGRDSLDVAESLTSLGALKMDKGDFTEAEKMIREGLEIRRKHLGPEHVAVAESLNNIGSVQYWKGDHKSSEATFREALAIQRKALGEESLIVADTLNNLAMALKVQEKYAEATPLYLEALSIRQKTLGPNHPLVAQSANNLAMLYLRVKNYPEAERLFQEALSVNRKTLGEVHPEVVANLNNLALLSLERGQLSLAEDYYRQTIAMDEKVMGASSPLRAQYVQSLGVVFTREKKFAEAEESLRKAVSLKLLTFDKNHYEIATTNNLLGACLTDQKRYREAEPLLVESYSIIKKQFGLQHDRTRRAGARLVTLYEASGQKDKAAALQAELGPSK